MTDNGIILKKKNEERSNNGNKMESEWHILRMMGLDSSLCSLARSFSYIYTVLKLLNSLSLIPLLIYQPLQLLLPFVLTYTLKYACTPLASKLSHCLLINYIYPRNIFFITSRLPWFAVRSF
jgi:hypothetical protein